jgi:hypothetical protein
MNSQQRVAIEHHCRLGFETAHRRFSYMGGPFHSIVLSVNSGYE